MINQMNDELTLQQTQNINSNTQSNQDQQMEPFINII
jgi:hypothetical protein